MLPSVPTVFLVDDDGLVRQSLDLLMRSAGFATRAYASAEDFLDHYRDEPGPPCCLVLDVRMPGLSGLGLQQRLAAEGIRIPVVLITGYGNVPMAVQAMNCGAVDFLEKPVSEQTLLARVQVAIDRDAQRRRFDEERLRVIAACETLSAREREVMDYLVAGRSAKQIGLLFGIGEKTVAKHRASLFQKLGVDNLASLACMAIRFGLVNETPDSRVRVPAVSES